jgi:hypothetical protein
LTFIHSVKDGAWCLSECKNTNYLGPGEGRNQWNFNDLILIDVRNLMDANGNKTFMYLGMSPRRGGAGLSPFHNFENW